MRRSAARAVGAIGVALGLAAAVHAAPGDTFEASRLGEDGTLPPGMAGLVLVVDPIAYTGHQPAPVERWDAVIEIDGGERWRLPDATAPAIFVVPAGRYRFDTIRSASGQQINGIMTVPDHLELVAGAIGYAGRWWIDTKTTLDRNSQVRGGFAFPREPIAALPPGPLQRHPFLVVRVNEKPVALGKPAPKAPAR